MGLYAIICLPDAHPHPASIGIQGMKRPGDFHWHPKLEIHILDGRIFDLEHPLDREEFNAAVENFAKFPHRSLFPVVRILYMGPPAKQPKRPAPPPPPPVIEDEAPARPVVSPQAAKWARANGVDVDQVQGTGIGGLVTLEDVRRAHAGQVADIGTGRIGNLSTAELSQELAAP